MRFGGERGFCAKYHYIYTHGNPSARPVACPSGTPVPAHAHTRAKHCSTQALGETPTACRRRAGPARCQYIYLLYIFLAFGVLPAAAPVRSRRRRRRRPGAAPPPDVRQCPTRHRLRVFGAQSVNRRFHEAKSIDFESDQLQVV